MARQPAGCTPPLGTADVQKACMKAVEVSFLMQFLKRINPIPACSLKAVEVATPASFARFILTFLRVCSTRLLLKPHFPHISTWEDSPSNMSLRLTFAFAF